MLLLKQDTEYSRFKLANDRLRVLMADAHDIFAADILYLKKCYSFYLTQIRKEQYSQEETKILNERKECEVYVMKKNLKLLNVLIDSNAYLMIELIQDIHEVSLRTAFNMLSYNIPIFKKRLVKELRKSIEFYIVGKKQFICKNIYLSFARMIRRHIERSTGREPLSFSELINNLKNHQPLQSLFNTIAWTLKPKA